MTAKSFERELQLHERIAAAGGAAFISSILVNPLDVVKTRMQAQATTKPPRPPQEIFSSAGIETRRWLLTSGMSAWPVRNPQEPPIYVNRPPASNYRSTLDGLLQIIKKEGVPTLWRGMDLNLLVGVPMVCLYLPLYDTLSGSFQSVGAGNLSPLLAGASARAATVLAMSPFELLKTRLQSAHSSIQTPGRVSYLSVWRSLGLQDQAGIAGKVRTLWTGVGATFLKDVPFAALYWSLLEPFKRELQKADIWSSSPHTQVLLVNSSAGAAAGGMAAAATIPFDVIKTYAQTNMGTSGTPMSVVEAMVSIARKRGVGALFAGWAPRAIRTAVAYSILMGAYEQCKSMCASEPSRYNSLVSCSVEAPVELAETAKSA